jgi:hypothetical protein
LAFADWRASPKTIVAYGPALALRYAFARHERADDSPRRISRAKRRKAIHAALRETM